MSYLVAKAITDIRGEFEGGRALSVDFFSLLERGARNVLDNINPETLKRRVPIYGGIAGSLALYYCPEDVKVPSAIYAQPNDRTPVAKYVPANEFYLQNRTDVFTLEYINGVRFLLIRRSVVQKVTTINGMDEVGSIISDQTLSVNNFNYISGTGALERTFNSSTTVGINEITETFSSALDLSDRLNGFVLIPLVLENAKNISLIRFTLETSDGNYAVMESSVDSVGDNLIDGLNLVRFKMNQRVETGTFDPASVTKWKLRINTVSGTTETVIIDKITVQKSAHYYFEYYSDRLFIDGTTGAWKTTPEKGDKVNLDNTARDILHYETVLLTAQGNTKIKRDRSGFDNFTAQLGRKYNAYWDKFPSTEQPLSYNQMDREMPYLPEYIGQNTHGDVEVTTTALPTTVNVDSETPTGVFDGVNDTFTLSHAPNPASSLILWLNGQLLTQGVDYTLTNNFIIFTSAPSALFSTLPFEAFYRYNP
jgi:hypothetical protein